MDGIDICLPDDSPRKEQIQPGDPVWSIRGLRRISKETERAEQVAENASHGIESPGGHDFSSMNSPTPSAMKAFKYFRRLDGERNKGLTNGNGGPWPAVFIVRSVTVFSQAEGLVPIPPVPRRNEVFQGPDSGSA